MLNIVGQDSWDTTIDCQLDTRMLSKALTSYFQSLGRIWSTVSEGARGKMRQLWELQPWAVSIYSMGTWGGTAVLRRYTGNSDGSAPWYIIFFLHVPLLECPSKDTRVLIQVSWWGLETPSLTFSLGFQTHWTYLSLSFSACLFFFWEPSSPFLSTCPILSHSSWLS